MLGRTPGHDRRDPPAQGRRHRRLRRHRADAAPLHPEGPPAPVCAPSRRRLRPLGRDRRREARRRGGDALRGRAPGLPDRGADGRRDRRRPARRRADREHDRRHRRRHDRGRRDLARRHRRLPEPPRRRRRDGRRDRQPHQEGVQAPDRPADRRGDQARGRLGLPDARGGAGGGTRPRHAHRPAEDGHPLLRGGPARARRAGRADHRRDPLDARQDAAGARGGHHGSRDRARRRRRAPERPRRAAASRDPDAGAPGGEPADLRRGRLRPQPRGVRGDPPQRARTPASQRTTLTNRSRDANACR